MKNLKLSFLFVIIIALLYNSKSSAEISDSVIYENDSVFTIEKIKDELSSEGEWIKIDKAEIDPDGVAKATAAEIDDNINTDYIWRPYNVPDGWTPYTNGYWKYTNCGWMWFSYYDWGWRPYHYGRWWWSPVWGWVWSPGFIWAPAWVVWMFWDDYCGWYPISPRVRHHRFYGWQCHNMRFHVRRWTFCHIRHFTTTITPIVIIDPSENKEIINKTKFISDITITKNGVINRGPDITQVEKYTGEKIAIENVTKYNNAEKYINTSQDESKLKKDEQVNDKREYKGKDEYNDKQKTTEREINKDNEKQKNSNREINKDTERKQYTPPKENNEKKSNDNIKKEYGKQKKESYTPPYDTKSDDPPKKESTPPPPPPPVKKNDDINKGNDSNKETNNKGS